MKHTYTHYIPQNVAPRGAQRIVVYDGNGKKVCTIPLGGLTPPSGEPLYSFGVVSDLHISDNTLVAWQPITKFDNALTAFESAGCAFCIATGDLTQVGFYKRTDESDASTTYYSDAQFAKYKGVCDAHTIPVYELCGNHESYYGMAITDNLDNLLTYTGAELYYTITQGDDLFVLLGQPSGSIPMSDDALTWLETTLTDNADKRCFVCVHPHLDSGNPVGAYTSNPIFTWWGTTKTNRFQTALRNHGNVILFHGHTHVKFQTQEQDDAAIYVWSNGYHSVHVPSLGVPRDVVDGALVGRDAESYGYIVDVYADGIHLRGYNFVDNEFLPIGSYWLDT